MLEASLLNMFDYEFMRNAFIAGTIAAVLAGAVGYFVIIRNLAFAAHALGHIGFAGATGGLLLGLSPLAGQFIFTLIAGIGIGAFAERISRSDMVIGIILSFCLGLGTLFLYFYNGYAGQANLILFGNLLSVNLSDLHLMFVLMLLSLFSLGVISKRLLFASLEPELAEAKGISLLWLSIIFIIIMTVAITLASQVVGVILVFALVIGPSAIAVQWTRQFWSGLLLSILLAVFVVWIGISLSYITNWPISFWICTLVFFAYLMNIVINRISAF